METVRDASQMAVLGRLEVSVEKLTGKSAEQLRQFTLHGFRRQLESEKKEPLRFVSRFPFVGRGNVLRDRILEGSRVERMLDCALK